MEPVVDCNKAQKANHQINALTTSKEEIISTIGRDFYKSVANINGLVSLLNNAATSDSDVETIHRYLSIEAHKLDFLVKGICG